MDTTSHQPLVLVDIDGVLNAFAARFIGSHQRIDRAGDYRVVLDTRHPAWFDRLADHAELVWATMWQADAGPVFGRVAGLGTEWPHLDFDSFWARLDRVERLRTGAGVGGYKWPRILEMGDTGRPLVWIDDDMTDAQLRWARRRDAAGTPTLFVRPDASVGLTERDFERVLEFCTDAAVPAPAVATSTPDLCWTPSASSSQDEGTAPETMRRTA